MPSCASRCNTSARGARRVLSWPDCCCGLRLGALLFFCKECRSWGIDRLQCIPSSLGTYFTLPAHADGLPL